MAQFKVIKCNKCSASLVELQGESLKNCVQCGFDFNPEFKKNTAYSSSLKKIKDTLDNTTQTQKQSKKPKKIANIEPKKTKSIVGTIFKWYMVFLLASTVLSQCVRFT